MQLDLFKKTKGVKTICRREKYIPSPEQVQRMLYIKELYDELGTLQRVADQMKITRERVRQQLNKGQNYQLFQYKLTRERRLNALIQRISRDELVKEIEGGLNRFNICSKFGISMNEYLKLLKFYQIDIQDYRIDARQKKYLIRYSNIVSKLGHHPSTTEMQRLKSWRYTGLSISRIWGSIDQFRKEYGIEKPPHCFSPNTKLVWQKNKNKSLARIEKIKKIIITYGPISLKSIADALFYNKRTVTFYLHKLFKENMVKRVIGKDGRTYRYFI